MQGRLVQKLRKPSWLGGAAQESIWVFRVHCLGFGFWVGGGEWGGGGLDEAAPPLKESVVGETQTGQVPSVFK